jgi:hypothetical protein
VKLEKKILNSASITFISRILPRITGVVSKSLRYSSNVGMALLILSRCFVALMKSFLLFSISLLYLPRS